MEQIIQEQAASYGLTIDQFTDLMSDAAAYQDYIEHFGEKYAKNDFYFRQ